LFNNHEGLELWNDGWDYKKRPNLHKMMEYLNQQLLQGKYASLKESTNALNSATHGDPLSARWNVVLRDDGAPVFLPSKNITSPQLADEICADVIPWVVATMGIMCAAFGQEDAISDAPKDNAPSRMVN
jgi:hypothetical protein